MNKDSNKRWEVLRDRMLDTYREYFRLEAMKEKAEEWEEDRAVTPLVVMAALLAVWLGLGTVCIIHVIGLYF